MATVAALGTSVVAVADSVWAGAPGDAAGIRRMGGAGVGASVAGPAGVRLGKGLSDARNLDGSGRAQLLVPGWADAEDGAVWLLDAHTVGSVVLDDVALASVHVGQGAKGLQAGVVGDLNGDGVDDLMIGLPRSGTNGEVLLLHGPVVGRVDADLAAMRLSGAPERSLFGGSVGRAGDLDGDGFDDVVVGGWGTKVDGAAMAGQVWIFHGPFDGAPDVRDATGTIGGEAAWDLLGFSMVGGADLDGDGLHDLALGATGLDGAEMSVGGVAIVPGPARGELMANAWILGLGQEDRVGWSVSARSSEGGGSPGRLVIGGPGRDLDGAPDVGAAWVLDGPFSGVIRLTESPDVVGALAGASAGYSVSLAADGVGWIGAPGGAGVVLSGGWSSVGLAPSPWHL